VTWEWLQSTEGATTSSVSSFSVSYASPLTAGSKMIAYVGSYLGIPETIGDVHGNDMGILAEYYVNVEETPDQLNMYFAAYCMDTPSADAGTTAEIKASFSNATPVTIGLQEVSGLAAGNTYACVDGSFAFNGGETTSVNEIADAYPQYTATYANEYMLSVLCYEFESSLTPPPGWTLDPNISASNFTGEFGMALAYTNSVEGTNDGLWTFPSTSSGNCFVIFDFAFLLPPSPAAPVPGRTNFRRQAVKRAAYY
jgi:hypothetical protein